MTLTWEDQIEANIVSDLRGQTEADIDSKLRGPDGGLHWPNLRGPEAVSNWNWKAEGLYHSFRWKGEGGSELKSSSFSLRLAVTPERDWKANG